MSKHRGAKGGLPKTNEATRTGPDYHGSHDDWVTRKMKREVVLRQ